MSMASRANIIGRLEHRAPTTDGSFSICIAFDEGAFVSQALYESIPLEHRPTLDLEDAGTTVEVMMVGNVKSLGSIFMPVILTNKETKKRFRIILRALVMPDLVMGMFIGHDGRGGFLSREDWERGVPTFGFNFGDPDGLVWVKGC